MRFHSAVLAAGSAALCGLAPLALRAQAPRFAEVYNTYRLTGTLGASTEDVVGEAVFGTLATGGYALYTEFRANFSGVSYAPALISASLAGDRSEFAFTTARPAAGCPFGDPAAERCEGGYRFFRPVGENVALGGRTVATLSTFADDRLLVGRVGDPGFRLASAFISYNTSYTIRQPGGMPGSESTSAPAALRITETPEPSALALAAAGGLALVGAAGRKRRRA